ncbi:MAG: Imm10 family immunity protein, partial [Dissulfurispiraceae bacterium]
IATTFSTTLESWGQLTELSAPSTEDADFYLRLQRKHKFSEQDIEWGQDKPYIEYCGQGFSWYGHITKFALFRDHISVQMDSHAANEMRTDGYFEVYFILNEADFNRLENALEKTFDGFDYYTKQSLNIALN